MVKDKKARTKTPVIIIPDNCYTKSAYARHINKTPTWVNKLIEQNKLIEISIKGGSFVVPTQ